LVEKLQRLRPGGGQKQIKTAVRTSPQPTLAEIHVRTKTDAPELVMTVGRFSVLDTIHRCDVVA
jgi:hypothetical protein